MSELHLLRESNLQDIPAMLRRLAESLERGEETATSCVVVLRRPIGAVSVFGYGATDSVRSFMDLHAGARELLE